MTRIMEKKLTYSDIEHIVEYLVGVKSHMYTFDCYSSEDIGQEIRIICLRAIEHFDFERVQPDKWANFFGRCVDNALKNLKRDNYIRFQSPCKSDCKFLHGPSDQLSKVCRKWLKHQNTVGRKKNVKNPLNIDNVGDVQDNAFEQNIIADDIKCYLVDTIDDDLRPALIRLLNGDRSINAKERKKIQTFVKEAMEDLGSV